MKRKKKFLIYFFIVIHPFFVFFCKTCIEFDIAFNRPDLTYKGDKTVPEADIIHLDKITLRDLREDYDKTQSQISKVLNMQLTVYQRYERGEREIPFWVAIKLADYYNVSLDYIAERSNKK